MLESLFRPLFSPIGRYSISGRGQGGGGSPIIPAMAALTDIPGLVVDFDGSDSSTMVLAGTLVTEWANKGSYGGKATSSGTNRPNYGTRTMGTLPTLDFSGTNHMDLSAEVMNLTAAAYSLFRVWDNDLGATFAIHDYGKNSGGTIRTGLSTDVSNVDDRIYQYSGASAIPDGSAPEDAGPTITQLRGTTSLAYNYVNGITRSGANGAPTYGAMLSWRFGGDPSSTGSRWNGLISEIVGYNRVLTIDEGALVLGFLAWKWGLQALIAGEWATKDPRTNPRLTNMIAFGDSFTELAYLVDVNQHWTNIVAARMGRLVADAGIGGQTSTQVTDRSIADVNYTDRAHIFFCGTNGPDSGHTVLGDIQNAVADLAPGTKFLILPSFNSSNEPAGSAGYINKMANNAAVAAAFPNNWLDIRSMLIALQAPGQPYQDGTAYAGDYLSANLRYFNGTSTDALHPNATCVALYANMIADWIEAHGW
ncbi:SGNH/GDSL hydrolase family protein [Rhizobium ruizarguesonis]|uniref:SGNH/GDSL hydrolase family protein n=1 Tax=Rhizobium ruizarguesonis TaxID=2081791 RepID=UPI00102FE3F0|nr:SGNH/GDSL hydrolase family protein [Rhizobium ruizarguesonis]TBA38412.1 SGNH/GDSL hydrolase family protein [Rhizobium ruizarguesonis]